jgi:hypothetical protein
MRRNGRVTTVATAPPTARKTSAIAVNMKVTSLNGRKTPLLAFLPGETRYPGSRFVPTRGTGWSRAPPRDGVVFSRRRRPEAMRRTGAAHGGTIRAIACWQARPIGRDSSASAPRCCPEKRFPALRGVRPTGARGAPSHKHSWPVVWKLIEPGPDSSSSFFDRPRSGPSPRPSPTPPAGRPQAPAGGSTGQPRWSPATQTGPWASTHARIRRYQSANRPLPATARQPAGRSSLSYTRAPFVCACIVRAPCEVVRQPTPPMAGVRSPALLHVLPMYQ